MRKLAEVASGRHPARQLPGGIGRFLDLLEVADQLLRGDGLEIGLASVGADANGYRQPPAASPARTGCSSTPRASGMVRRPSRLNPTARSISTCPPPERRLKLKEGLPRRPARTRSDSAMPRSWKLRLQAAVVQHRQLDRAVGRQGLPSNSAVRAWAVSPGSGSAAGPGSSPARSCGESGRRSRSRHRRKSWRTRLARSGRRR